MMKIVDYTAVSATKNKGLGPIVKCYIDQGWQPYGNPYLDRNGVERQALVIYEEEPLKIVPAVEGEELEPIFVKVSENKPATKAKPKKGAKKNED